MDDLLLVLACVAPLAVARAFSRDFARGRTAALAAAGLALAFGYFAAGHFAVTDELVEMLPPWLPARRLAIHATGILEAGIAVMLCTRRWRTLAAGLAIAVLILFLPANVYAAFHHVGVGAHREGPSYLAIRIPLQAFFIAWASLPIVTRNEARHAAA
ncbi:hypothetical protein ASG87_15855 [Frateuria sp. Soil773]|uniref:DoxX family protein n=1 Tax=Frateuria sp. Soil773 TaxID=1736407 RepID=UPI0006F22538|nr:hypothetical protein [Frateuria sp. Soil773]KRE96795.1 hypothetical protein ASG87_15855 [Frateuria sp. Soil773]